MPEQDELTDAEAIELIEEVTSEPEKKESRGIEELIDKEQREATKTTIVLVLSTILFFLMIVVIILTSEPILYLLAFLLFLGILVGISSLINRKMGKRDYIDSFTLSERYKFYLDKLAKLLPKYNAMADKKPHTKRIIKYMADLYFLATDWDSVSVEEGKPNVYIDLFTGDLDEFNFKLRMLLLRINGFIDELEDIPKDVCNDLTSLSHYLNRKSLKIDETHFGFLNSSLEYLEKNNPNTYKLEFYEPIILEIAETFLSKTWKWFVGINAWLIIGIICAAFITNIGVNLSTDMKFYGFITAMGLSATALVPLLKGR